ncbi:hypothetical protein U9M48_012098 [Paspalum notatum var. saurae]|uniref:AP2/ERF domain-containing protein n=1 Tax=Paspalum notatum var. saurae TaxID=547442 RepID=A0AAQ3WI07_PASNO
MELQFQQQQQQQCGYQVVPATKETTKPSCSRVTRGKCGGGGKFVGVRQRPSGRWVAEIKDTTQKIRMWLGTFETAEEAARAYDEAACLLRGANTRTNFAVAGGGASGASPPDSPLAARIRGMLNHKKLRKTAPQPPPTVTFFPAACRRAGDEIARAAAAAAAAASSTSTSTITTSGVSTPSSSPSSSINFAMTSNNGVRTPILAAAQSAAAAEEEAYRPYLMGGGGGEEFQRLASQQQCQYEQPWQLHTSSLPLPPADNGCAEMAKIKTEKQCSAANHGEERVHQQNRDFSDAAGNDASDSLWDLPPICPLSSRSLMYS